MTGAAFGDRFGRRRGFTAGLAIFVAGSAACALAPSVEWLIAARAVQGAGAALVMPLGMALVSSAFAPERRGQALGIYFGVTGLAVASGPVVGGAITEGLAWEWIFWINVPLGLALLPLISRRIAESRGPDGTLDLVGLLLVGLAAFGVVWGLVRGNLAGWSSAEVIAAFAAGVGCAALFVAWERRVADPMLPLRFFRSRAFAAGNAARVLRRRLAVRRGVLPRPVPADRPRLRAARRRRAAAAVDADAVLRRARSRARWSTATASGRSWSAGCCCRGSAWAGSR